MELDSEIPFTGGYSSGGYSSGYPLKRSGSVELRAGKIYKSCDCIKRNGLQLDCRRTECLGRSCCMSSGASCSPGNSARRLANFVMGIGARAGGAPRYSNYQQYQNMPSMSGDAPDMNMRGVAAQYSFNGIGDGSGMQPTGSELMNFNTNYGGPMEAYSQFMPQSQVAPYGACLTSNEGPMMNQYSSYGPQNIPCAAPFGDYVQG